MVCRLAAVGNGEAEPRTCSVSPEINEAELRTGSVSREVELQMDQLTSRSLVVYCSGLLVKWLILSKGSLHHGLLAATYITWYMNNDNNMAGPYLRTHYLDPIMILIWLALTYVLTTWNQ